MPLTIVMYHYVRDLERSRYPCIKGRDLAGFRRQLDHIAANYEVVTAEQVVAAARGDGALPGNAAWLTFDDGYLDHFTSVLPLLHDRGWQGSFFPPVRPIRDRQLLDVNKVHFILAASPSPEPILAEIRSFIEDKAGGNGVRPFADYWAELGQASRLDPAEVIFIKRILQHGLPEALRNQLASALFERFVSVDPAAFASELYMTVDQLRLLIDCGMYVGSHGGSHYWLNQLSADRQAADIRESLDFIGELGASVDNWVMCYPYGGYDDSLLGLLQEMSCAVGLTTKVGVADLATDHPLTLPRLDTNDLPA